MDLAVDAPVADRVRLRLDIAYDGTEFVGWARQPGLRSVEMEVTSAVREALRSEFRPKLICAGRTDAGVHARGQVAHVDLLAEELAGTPAHEVTAGNLEVFQASLNGILPRDVVVRGISVPAPGFDARFAALSRVYSYRVADHAAAVDPVRRHETLVIPRRLDLGLMNEAALQLLGRHDFAAFCRRSSSGTTIRTLLGLTWKRGPDGAATLWVEADAFCQSMIRSLVGALLPVGRHRKPVTWPQELLRAGRRDPQLNVMPAHPLVLEAVNYPDPGGYAERVARTRARRDGV